MRIMAIVGVATGTSQRNPGAFMKGLCGGYRVLTRADHCPAKGQPLHERFGVFFCAPSVLHTLASAYLGSVEEKSSRYAKARVQFLTNPVGWLYTHAWGSEKSDMCIRYIRGETLLLLP